jgi:gluconolactonase
MALFASTPHRALRAQGNPDPPTVAPAATLNLMTRDGVAAVQGQWRYHDVRIIEVDYRGSDGKPGRTYDYEPHAGKKEFDDSDWEIVDPTTLGKARSTGKICFSWYRFNLTVPEKVGNVDTAGSTLVFDTTVDDYGEIWVDGKLNYRFGQQGGAVVAGFNAPNRLVVGRNLKPGQKIAIAVFGINGPISAAPDNYIFLRQAKLEFYKP